VHRVSHVAVLAADAELGAGLPEEDLRWARRHLLVPRLDVPVGPWRPAAVGYTGRESTTLLVVAGLLMAHVRAGDRGVAMLLGRGDIVDTAALGGAGMTWTAATDATLAALDGRFDIAAQRWPVLAEGVRARLGAQLGRAMRHAAILAVPKIEPRLLAVLELLAERWGEATDAGTVVPLALTQADLARLCGVRRPTVTPAVAGLQKAGLARRRHDRTWLLPSPWGS